MKYLKMLALATVAAAALMAFVGAGIASATTLTSPPGTDLKAGTKITAVSETERPTLTGGFKNIGCNESTIGGEITNAGGAASTVSGPVQTLTFTGNCTCEVVVIEKGSLEIHVIGAGPNGTLTSTGARVTVNCSTIFGPVHCIYKTNATDLGTLTGTGVSTATMDITAEIPRENTSGLCAEEAILHAKYLVTSPDPLLVS
jgi:hypothetical protein